jgi:hypothetical protein
MPYGSTNPNMNMQRNAITQALLNVQNPPPRTQMPGMGAGAPTQSPIVPSGVAASPNMQGAGGAVPPPAQGSPSLPGGVPPGMGAMGAPMGMPGVGAPQSPQQMGGAPLPPPQNVPGLVGQQPPQVGQLPGTQLPGMPGQLGRY